MADDAVLSLVFSQFCKQNITVTHASETSPEDVVPYLSSLLEMPVNDAESFRYDPNGDYIDIPLHKEVHTTMEKPTDSVSKEEALTSSSDEDDIEPKEIEKFSFFPQRRSAKSNTSGFVRAIIAGRDVSIYVSVNEDTFYGLKMRLSLKTGTPIDQLRLRFDRQWPRDGQKLIDVGVRPGSIVEATMLYPSHIASPLVLRLGLDDDFVKDYRQETPDGMNNRRGGAPYLRPYGWKRYGLMLRGVYDSDAWLGRRGPRICGTPDEWPVGYAVMSVNALDNVAQLSSVSGATNTFLAGQVMTTPRIETAEEMSAPLEYEGRRYKVVLQTRVNPSGVNKINVEGSEIWLNSNVDGVRPYGVLVKDLSARRPIWFNV